jgi:hypothetical protein
MNQEQILAIMNDPWAQKLINAPVLARLAYNSPKGEPRVIPIGYLWNGKEIVVCTVPNAPKIRALRKNPAVALTIDTNDYPPNVLLIRGTASIEIVDGVPDDYVEASRRIVGEANMPEWEAGVRQMYKQMARVAITPTWAKILDFETRLPSFVEELLQG